MQREKQHETCTHMCIRTIFMSDIHLQSTIYVYMYLPILHMVTKIHAHVSGLSTGWSGRVVMIDSNSMYMWEDRSVECALF